jgi:Tripartite tricarboxylate transporter family receptor
MVYPFAAGSAADVLGRLFASRLSELLGQTVVFENVGGAGGMIGSNRVAKAAPDGYQFVLGGTFMVLNQALYKNPLYNATTDFAPVVLIVEQPVVLIARKDFPAKDLSEFIAYARANQAKMQYGSGGVGSMPHMSDLIRVALRTRICCCVMLAADCRSRVSDSAIGFLGLTRKAASVAVGATSCSSSNCLGASMLVRMATPVMLPSGRLRLLTSPN